MFALRRAVLASSAKLPSAAPAPLLLRHATSDVDPPPPKGRDDREGSQDVLSRAAEAISETAQNVKEKLKYAAGMKSDNNRQDAPIDRLNNRVSEAASEAWQGTKQNASETYERAKQTAKDAQEGAMDRGTQAKENLKETAENVKRAAGAGSGSAEKPE